MRAVVFKGAFDVAEENVADPGIEKPLDAVVRVTTANICGSDLHPYEGRAPLDAGMVLGHENMGVVEAWTAASRPSATRPMTRPDRSIRRWCWTSWSRWSGPPAGSA